MKKIKLIVSVLVILVLVSATVVSACPYCTPPDSVYNFCYTYIDETSHNTKCSNCHHLFGIDAHGPCTWIECGIGWDEYGNKFHDIEYYCDLCGGFAGHAQVTCDDYCPICH